MSIGIGIGISLTISGYAYDGNAPINIVPPFISGGVNFGDTLTTTNGTWASDSGVLSYLCRHNQLVMQLYLYFV